MSTKVNPKAEEVAKEQKAIIKGGALALPPIPGKVMEETISNLEAAVMGLVSEGRFFSSLVMNMRREVTNRLATLGVNVTDEVNLFINPYFFNALTYSERMEVLKHECYHVINDHFSRFRDIEPQIFEKDKMTVEEIYKNQQSASLLNQAADYAINEYLPNLPRNFKCFHADGTVQAQPATLPDGKPNPDAGKPVEGNALWVKDLAKKIPHIAHQQNLEYYYEFLKQKQEQDKKNGKGKGQGQGDGDGQMTLDDHSIWHEGDATQDEIKEKVKQVVNKAAEQCDERDMGNLPADVRHAIEMLNHVPKDWKQDLQRFVARTSEIIQELSRKKRNRRYGVMYPGTITYPKLHLAIGIDSSGSVNDEELSQFFAEIKKLHTMNVELTIIECDTQVNGVYKFDPKKPFAVNGRGGTSFKPVFDESNKQEVDGLIYFTDGECYDEGVKRPQYPVLWAITGGRKRQPPYKWGARTWIEIKKKVRV